MQYGFICGGGGARYSRTLQLLNPGDRVWVKVPGTGFVGVGRATGRSQPAASFSRSYSGREASSTRSGDQRQLPARFCG